jgi:hypothetical protein
MAYDTARTHAPPTPPSYRVLPPPCPAFRPFDAIRYQRYRKNARMENRRDAGIPPTWYVRASRPIAAGEIAL